MHTTLKITNILSKYLAEYQYKACVSYYIDKNRNMSSYYLEKVEVIRDLACELGLLTDVYNKSLDIFDFSNSGRTNYYFIDIDNNIYTAKMVKENVF